MSNSIDETLMFVCTESRKSYPNANCCKLQGRIKHGFGGIRRRSAHISRARTLRRTSQAIESHVTYSREHFRYFAHMNVASSARCHLRRWTWTSVKPACVRQRAFASEANPQLELDANTSASTKDTPSWKAEGRMRPQPNQPLSIDPNHPLYAFFRKDVWSKKQEIDPNALPGYLPFEPYWAPRFASGAPPLTLISFRSIVQY